MRIELLGMMFLAAVLVVSAGCKSEFDYEATAVKELQSGSSQNEIFFGLYFGMTRDSFYRHCAELNRQRLLQQGSQGVSVEYVMNELSATARMNFFPVFEDDIIIEMPVTFAFDNWAPWNQESHSRALIEELVELFESWYGGSFHLLTTADGRTGLVQVKGNRRVLLFLDGEQRVKGLISDMTVIPYHLDAIHL